MLIKFIDLIFLGYTHILLAIVYVYIRMYSLYRLAGVNNKISIIWKSAYVFASLTYITTCLMIYRNPSDIKSSILMGHLGLLGILCISTYESHEVTKEKGKKVMLQHKAKLFAEIVLVSALIIVLEVFW